MPQRYVKGAQQKAHSRNHTLKSRNSVSLKLLSPLLVLSPTRKYTTLDFGDNTNIGIKDVNKKLLKTKINQPMA
jgi:hypothetical protein